MDETFAAIDTLVALVAEHKDLEASVHAESWDPSRGEARWHGFVYGPPASLITPLSGWARDVRRSR